MTSGAKAGLAIGLILGLGALLALCLFCYRRKKQQRQNEAYQKAEDEKNPFGSDGAAFAAAREPSFRSTRTASTAPRLSLRPVTQFLPEMTTGANRGNAMAMSPIGANSNTSQGNGATQNGLLQNQANNPANPFGNHAESSDHFSQAEPVLGSSPPAAQVPAPLSVRPATPDLAALAAGAGVAVGVVGANAAHHHNGPSPTTPMASRDASHAPQHPMEGAMPSPAGTEFSMTSISSADAATGPPPANVHRVQMDFKPSMDDEIELRSGQLVRLLHEYDDGWVSFLIFPSRTSAAANTRFRRFAFASTALSKAWPLVPVSRPARLSLALPGMAVDLHHADHTRWGCAVFHNNDLPRLPAAVARQLLTTEFPDRCHPTVNAQCPLAHTAVVLSSAQTSLHLMPGEGATLQPKFARGETVHRDLVQ